MDYLAQAQPSADVIPLSNLSFFAEAGKNWQIVGDINADITRKEILNVVKGTGVLVNLPAGNTTTTHLWTTATYGDFDLELDYLMGKESNSGIYLQGRYEVQLLDSWLAKEPDRSGNGAIYGFRAARQNASKAPGLWQHLKLTFRAPRFDQSGKKVENARLIKAELNGTVIHDNLELPGPTAGAIGTGEVASGPLLIQGDHGPVAFRNIRLTDLSGLQAYFQPFQYSVYKGSFTQLPDFSKIKPHRTGVSQQLLSNVSPWPNEYLIRYQGKLHVAKAGIYTVFPIADHGFSVLTINGNEVFDWDSPNWRPARKVNLPAGDLDFEIIYSKIDLDPAALGLWLNGPGLSPFYNGDSWASVGAYDHDGPVYVEANENTLLRSFIYLPDEDPSKDPYFVAHGISAGTPAGINYTYDLDNGALVQVWRGHFLDASPMWKGRGDAFAIPTGTVTKTDLPGFIVNRLPDRDLPWQRDTLGSGYRFRGYLLDDKGLPTFEYNVFGMLVKDKPRVMENGAGIRRELLISGAQAPVFACLAEGSKIIKVSENLYLIGEKQFFIRFSPRKGQVPEIRNSAGNQQLIVSVASGAISYELLF